MLCTEATDCKYKEYDRRLKEQFINGLVDENMEEEIIRELTASKDTSEVISKQILLLAQRMEVQKVQKEVSDNIIEETGRSIITIGCKRMCKAPTEAVPYQ